MKAIGKYRKNKINKNKLRYRFYQLGAAFLSTCMFLMLLTFFTAYVQPSKTVTVTIDSRNEANVELIMILMFLPITIFLLYDMRVNLLPKIKEGKL